MAATFSNTHGFTAYDYDLYGRQLILPEIGVEGQRRLKASRVVVVGAGGLGSPACLYLSGSGIGSLCIVDEDTVALSNLHRQVIHDLTKINRNKAVSAAEECRRRNDTISITPIPTFVTSGTILSVLRDATVVVDATDNAQSRYLINDACAHLRIPLVSGSALRWEGQLTVYNSQTPPGPCYRCLFPQPPALNNAGACDMQGVIGPAPGIIGTLQALEALKICLGRTESSLVGRMLLFDGLNPTRMWRNVKLRGARDDCGTCRSTTSVCLNEIQRFCPDEMYPSLPEEQIICSSAFFRRALQLVAKQDSVDLPKLLTVRRCVFDNSEKCCVLLDVRPATHFNAIHIDGSINIPISKLLKRVSQLTQLLAEQSTISDTGLQKLEDWSRSVGICLGTSAVIYCICRRGRDASKATQAINQLLHAAQAVPGGPYLADVQCINVQGGMMALRANVKELKAFPTI